MGEKFEKKLVQVFTLGKACGLGLYPTLKFKE
jgi:hypothetical protein